jgi:hypothetical protein
MEEPFDSAKGKINLTAEEAKKLSEDTWTYTIGVVSEVSKNLKEKTPKFDFKKIGESAAESAAAGGVVGAGVGALAGGAGIVPGGVAGAGIGAISGATGEVARQIAVHNGATEGLANGIKIGTEVGTGAGLAKVAQKTAEGLHVGGKEIASQVMETKSGEVVAKQYDEVARFSQDKIKTIGFEAKGLVKNLQTHEFVDGLGKPLLAKIEDVVDFSRTIKMPYLGSNISGTNAAGFERNSSKFAKMYAENYPETLSENNLARALEGKAPIVDMQWIKYNPNHKTFFGEKLQHHHINNTGSAAYVPFGLHSKEPNHTLLHVHNMELGQEMLNAAKNLIPGRS